MIRLVKAVLRVYALKFKKLVSMLCYNNIRWTIVQHGNREMKTKSEFIDKLQHNIIGNTAVFLPSSAHAAVCTCRMSTKIAIHPEKTPGKVLTGVNHRYVHARFSLCELWLRKRQNEYSNLQIYVIS